MSPGGTPRGATTAATISSGAARPTQPPYIRNDLQLAVLHVNSITYGQSFQAAQHLAGHRRDMPGWLPGCRQVVTQQGNKSVTRRAECGAGAEGCIYARVVRNHGYLVFPVSRSRCPSLHPASLNNSTAPRPDATSPQSGGNTMVIVGPTCSLLKTNQATFICGVAFLPV